MTVPNRFCRSGWIVPVGAVASGGHGIGRPAIVVPGVSELKVRYRCNPGFYDRGGALLSCGATSCSRLLIRGPRREVCGYDVAQAASSLDLGRLQHCPQVAPDVGFVDAGHAVTFEAALGEL